MICSFLQKYYKVLSNHGIGLKKCAKMSENSKKSGTLLLRRRYCYPFPYSLTNQSNY